MSTNGKLAVAGLSVAALALGVGLRLGFVQREPASARAVGRPGEKLAGMGDTTAAVAADVTAGGRTPGSNNSHPALETIAGRGRSPRPPLPRLVAVPATGAPASDPNPPQQRGALDKEEIRRAMRRVVPGLKQCYARLLEDQPQALGRLMFHFTIADDGNGGGRVSEASIKPQAADAGAPELIAPLAEQCMLNAIAAAPFPAPRGGPVVVSYPFAFSPGGEPPPL